MVIDRDVDELPSDAAAAALAVPVAGDAVAGSLEPAELFDVDVCVPAGNFARPRIASARNVTGRLEIGSVPSADRA